MEQLVGHLRGSMMQLRKAAKRVKIKTKIPTWLLIVFALFLGCVGIICLQVGTVIPSYLAWSSELGRKAWSSSRWLRDTGFLLIFGIIGFVATKLASKMTDIVLERLFWKDVEL